MASESAAKVPPATQPSNPADSYIGSTISLVSKCEIRYEGVLYFLSLQDSTIGLKNVRSYGTEGRRKDGPHVPPSERVYEYILFRVNDIKDLQIKSPLTSAKSEEQVSSDPAIIQAQSPYSGVQTSPMASVGGRSLTGPNTTKDTPVVTSKTLPLGLPLQVSPSNQFAATQVAGHPSFSGPMYWQGHSGISSNNSNSPLRASSLQSPSMESPFSVQNQMQTSERSSAAAVAASHVNLTWSPSPTCQISDSFDVPPLFCAKTSMPYSTSMTFNGSNMHSCSSPLQDINSVDDQLCEKICPNSGSIYPGHSVLHPASFVGSTSCPFPTPPSLLTPDQFAHPEEQLSPLSQNLIPKQQYMILTSSGSSISMPSPPSQAPLLPLPNLVQKPQSAASQFTEEFDFEGMNEKFKKDEVWGSLGKATTNIQGVDDVSSPISLGDIHGKIPSPKCSYKKDDFFDTISCNSTTRGRNGQNHLFQRMKLDTQTFGNLQQRPNVYGGYGAGRGASFRGSYNSGRGYGYGYGYGGRGRGQNFHF